MSRTWGIVPIGADTSKVVETLDRVFFSLGITRDGFFISMNDDQFDEVIDINLKVIDS
jgi:NAD(P)-dependent dehydrogenase (short-subunit alcohol dehydrogenase family)